MSEQVEMLLVEDSEADVLLIQEALKDARIKNKLHVARDGQQAIDFLADNRPGLVLLDLYLPKKNGLDVLRYIKSDPRLKATPVVVMTSSQEERDIAEAYELQANCYVTKPVDFEQLTVVIKSIENFWLTLVKLPPKK